MRIRLLSAFPLVAALLSAETLKDVEYGRPGGVSLTLDATIPDGLGPFPAAILVHGGGWVAGDKQQYITYIFEPLTRARIAWFSINYRLAPKYMFPAAMEDIESAIRYVKANAVRYHIDPQRVALIGESAGGHLVSWVGAQDHPDARVRAVVSFYGLHDLISRAVQQCKLADVGVFFGVERLTADTAPLLVKGSPIIYVHRGMPPYLLIHGTQDEGVPFQQSTEMCEKMKRAGAACDLIPVNAGHGMDRWEPHAELHEYKQQMIDWLQSKLR